MKLSQADFFAIKSYSFAIRKTNSFFSITTVLLSLAIITASILINYSTVSHLWLPRQKLPLLSSQSLAYPPPFTRTLVCFRPNIPKNGTISAKMYLNDINFTEITAKYVSQAEVQKRNPKLAKQIGGNFGCLNFENIAFTPSAKQYLIQVFSQNVTLFISCESITSLVNDIYQQAIVMQSDQQGLYPYYRAQVISATISDRLLVGYEPQIISTFQKSNIGNLFQVYAAPFNTPNMLFGIKLYSPINFMPNSPNENSNLLTVSITRLDIGFIVGAVLSWISIFALFSSLIVGPLMDKVLNLIQAETIFYVKPEFRLPSVFKFMLASIKSGLFPKEDIYVKLSQKLGYFKDIALLLKTKMTLKRLNPLVCKASSDEIIGSQQSFNTPQNEEFGIQFYSDKVAKKNPNFVTIQDQAQQNIIVRVRKGFLTWLDGGSNAISINYKGRGHGSTESVGLSFLFLIGFLLFLQLFGVFQLNTSTDIYNVANLSILQYTFTTDEIFFQASNPDFTIQLLTGNYKPLQTVPLVSNHECFLNFQASTFSQYNIAQNQVFCFQTPVTIRYDSNKQEEIIMYINNTQLFNDDINIFHSSLVNQIEEITPIENFFNVPPLSWFTDCLNTKELRVFYQQAGDVQYKTGQFLPDSPCMTNIFDPNQVIGYNIRANQQLTEISTTTTTFFDVLQNVWGFAVICFTVLLMKLTKYINIRQKDMNVSPEKAEFRDSLCILLSKVNGLLVGRNSCELSRARYYVKQDMKK